MRFDELKSKWNWKPIHACSGRYVLLGVDNTLSPEALLNHEVEVSEFHVDKAKDIVIVAKFKDGGLISYKKIDGTYLHTLNTIEGFERKLSQLEISLNDAASSD
jgi:hypothetical protein